MSAFESIVRNKRRLLPFGILLVLAIVIFFTLRAAQQNQDQRSQAAVDNGQLTFANLSSGCNASTPATCTVTISMNGSGQTVVGADILVTFDRTKLQLASNGIVPPTNRGVYSTYAPVDTNGNFNVSQVVSTANSTGVVEFGIVSFNWAGNTLTSPNPSSSVVLNVATLTFNKVAGQTGSTPISFRNDGITATTDSNIVVNPVGGDPEDILQPLPYANSSVNVVLTSTTPSSTPQATPVATATPAPSGSTCPATCFNFGGSSTVDIQDITLVANRWGQTVNATNAIYNLNCDTVINVVDITLVANRWGQTSCLRQ